MARLRLRPDHLAVLKAISKNGPIAVKDLGDYLEYDRGTIEAAIGSLERDGHIDKQTEVVIQHKLTNRGKKASQALPEREILEVLREGPVPIGDLSEMTGLEKGDISAGIGILRNSDIISIDKGEVSLKSSDGASTISSDLKQSLQDLSNGKTRVSEELAQKLLARGFIEIIETTSVTVSTSYSDRKVSYAQPYEEITKLTPQMLTSGSWREASFKPYSLETKPRIIHGGRMHPYREFLEQLKRKLVGLGFEEMKGPLVEQEFWNFDALYAPQDHPAREDSDILLINSPSHGVLIEEDYVQNVAKTHEDGWKTGSRGHRYDWDPKKAARLLLRPQGTSISARTLVDLQPPAKYFSIARCYRPDQVDATHAIEFNQTEGIICDPNTTFRDLLGMLETFAIEVAGARNVRFRPDYYPFTSPSVELSAEHPVLGFMEFGGAGMFRPEVTQPFGIDYPVLAWGLGVGRLFMTKYHISDIRELFSQNLDWLRTEPVSSGIEVGGD